jgi:hypothetical protein
LNDTLWTDIRASWLPRAAATREMTGPGTTMSIKLDGSGYVGFGSTAWPSGYTRGEICDTSFTLHHGGGAETLACNDGEHALRIEKVGDTTFDYYFDAAFHDNDGTHYSVIAGSLATLGKVASVWGQSITVDDLACLGTSTTTLATTSGYFGNLAGQVGRGAFYRVGDWMDFNFDYVGPGSTITFQRGSGWYDAVDTCHFPLAEGTTELHVEKVNDDYLWNGSAYQAVDNFYASRVVLDGSGYVNDVRTSWQSWSNGIFDHFEAFDDGDTISGNGWSDLAGFAFGEFTKETIGGKSWGYINHETALPGIAIRQLPSSREMEVDDYVQWRFKWGDTLTTNFPAMFLQYPAGFLAAVGVASGKVRVNSGGGFADYLTGLDDDEDWVIRMTATSTSGYKVSVNGVEGNLVANYDGNSFTGNFATNLYLYKGGGAELTDAYITDLETSWTRFKAEERPDHWFTRRVDGVWDSEKRRLEYRLDLGTYETEGVEKLQRKIERQGDAITTLKST